MHLVVCTNKSYILYTVTFGVIKNWINTLFQHIHPLLPVACWINWYTLVTTRLIPFPNLTSSRYTRVLPIGIVFGMKPEVYLWSIQIDAPLYFDVYIEFNPKSPELWRVYTSLFSMQQGEVGGYVEIKYLFNFLYVCWWCLNVMLKDKYRYQLENTFEIGSKSKWGVRFFLMTLIFQYF
jgi:hypothetical protein